MGREYTISGVKVSFPFNAYPCQMAMMAKIIQGLKRRQNCLLESPTGSGKSLALLCAALAWQRAEHERIDEHNRQVALEEQTRQQQQLQQQVQKLMAASAAGLPAVPAAGSPAVPTAGSPAVPGAVMMPSAASLATPGPVQGAAAAACSMDTEDWNDDDFADFKTKGEKRLRLSLPQGDLMSSPTKADQVSSSSSDGDKAQQEPKMKRLKKPKIFFGTRTHKQIAQITSELRRTDYKHVKMTVLASRDHTCIHPDVSRSANKNDGCRELRDPHSHTSCGYFTRANQRLRYQEQLPGEGLAEAWPLEELVSLGRRIRACPYYAARNLKEEADIVFCPYNYLIEPGIREALEIDLRNHILVLDEAHNIEDSARDAASVSFEQAHIQDAIRDLEKCGQGSRQTQTECRDMARMLSHISQWIDRHSDDLNEYKEFDRGCKILTGTDMVAHFTSMGIGHEAFPDIAKAYGAIMAEEMDNSEESQWNYVQRLTSGTTTLLGQLVRELGFIYADDMKCRDDFRIALVKSMSRRQGPESKGGWLSSRRKSHEPMWTRALHFWCLNPAVVFGAVGEAAHSVIVASGTLSPMRSFQSELGVPFPVLLEASHVIKPEQVYVAAISHGPRGGSMNATYRNSEQYSFQDELGELILGVCGAVPNGVLCFFPSYGMLDKLTKRWRLTGLWDRLDARKPILCEPRRANEFEDMMRQFRHLVEGDESGALLLAVCRGKLSEGIDFSDNSARAVITVGIPFPNVKDVQVDLKKLYNNAHASSRGLLSGGEWYSIQAYRALNQALGRCIRHRYDWGAILLVDDRFSRPRGADGLSRWVRSMVRHHSQWPAVQQQLRDFTTAMERWTQERHEELRQQASAEAASVAASALLPEHAASTTSAPASSSSPLMSPGSVHSLPPPPAAGAEQFQYGSPPPAGAAGGQRVVLVPLGQFSRAAGAPAQEIVTVNGQRFLRLTEEGRTRLVPLLTARGTPVTADGDALSEAGLSPGQQEKRQRASDDSGDPPAPGSPALFDESGTTEDSVQPAVTAAGVGRRPMFRHAFNSDLQSLESESPDLVRKTVLPPRASTANQRSKRQRGVIFISSDEED